MKKALVRILATIGASVVLSLLVSLVLSRVMRGRIEPGKGVWEAKAADGRTMKLTLYVSECSDGMSDLKYPMAAEAELSGSETLRGCAAKTADLAREAPR